VSFDTINTLIENGIHDLASLKRQSRAGMGQCQGRYCQNQIATILGEKTGRFPQAEELFAPELPVKPIAIRQIAAEKPEWLGYRTVDLPDSTTTPVQQQQLPAETNVLVIGAGIIGIATALYLAREGIEVILVERNVANGQASGRNAGSLHLQLLSFDFSDNKEAGKSPAATALPLQLMGVNAWRELQQETGADFGLEISGGIIVAENDRDLEFLRRKAALERSYGIEVEILSRSDLRKAVPSVAKEMAGAAYCAGEGKINPMLATPRILAEAIKSGARIFERTTVTDIDRKNGNYLVTTNNGAIRCRNVVNAAGGWTANIAAMIGANIPVKTAPQQMIVTEPADTNIHHLLALAKRHLTMKQASNGNIIIGGGWPAAYQAAGDRAVTIADSLEGNLWVAQRIIPEIGLLQVIRSWATIGVMIDGAPVLGELPGYPRFFNAVAANGYTMGPMLGKITAGLIRSGRPIVNIQPFLVDRFASPAVGPIN
jgi:glycine/D-amino acid oxidase-like deaminating enzyme